MKCSSPDITLDDSSVVVENSSSGLLAFAGLAEQGVAVRQ
jgi:hypothetical protein